MASMPLEPYNWSAVTALPERCLSEGLQLSQLHVAVFAFKRSRQQI
jgi:hypothetical protein